MAAQLIHIDVDRLDYLRRDSLFTGAGYGHFDWHRLLTTMEFHDSETDLVWPAKSALAIEEYIFARYYMYQNVYFHKTTRGFEQLLQAMWIRANQLRQNQDSVNANPAPERFWKIEKPEPGKMPVMDYLAVEEFTVLEQIQRWTGHSDKGMADCQRRFLNRDGLAKVDPPPPVSPLKADDFGDWEPELHKLLRGKGYDEPTMYCLPDKLDGNTFDRILKRSSLTIRLQVNTIRVLVDGSLQDSIGQYLPRLAAVIAKTEDRIVYYVPKKIVTTRKN